MHVPPFIESDRPWGDLPLNKPRAFTAGKLVSNATVLVLTLFFAVPMLWLVLASIDQTASFQFKMPVPTINHYITAVEAENLSALANSLSSHINRFGVSWQGHHAQGTPAQRRHRAGHLPVYSTA